MIGITSGVFDFYSLKCDYSDLDPDRINIEGLYEKRFSDDSNNELLDLLGKEKFREIGKRYNMNSIYTIHIEGKEYFVFSVDDEGNVYCVDRDKKFYFMRHDPWSITHLDI